MTGQVEEHVKYLQYDGGNVTAILHSRYTGAFYHQLARLSSWGHDLLLWLRLIFSSSVSTFTLVYVLFNIFWSHWKHDVTFGILLHVLVNLYSCFFFTIYNGFLCLSCLCPNIPLKTRHWNRMYSMSRLSTRILLGTNSAWMYSWLSCLHVINSVSLLPFSFSWEMS